MQTLTLDPALEPLVREALAEVRARVASLTSSPGLGPREVVRRYDRLFEPLNGLEGLVGLYVSVHPDPAVRTQGEALEREIAELRTAVALDRGLYERLAGLDPRALDGAEAQRLLAHALRDFRRAGVDRDEATRARVRALQEELIALGQEFDRNIVTGGRELVIEDGAAGLAGLPPDFVAAHPPRADGSVVLGTDPHVRMAFMTYAERGDLRQAYLLAATNRAAPENVGVLARILARRHELATLLGYASWSDYATEDKMTRSAATARAFLEKLLERVRTRARAEAEELLAKKRERDPGATHVAEADRAYLIERVKAERLRLDSLAVRAYFPFERVQRGVLETAEELYGLRFRRDRSAEVWHPAVECWEVLEDGRLCGRFFLDLHPREGKYKHAAMFPVRDGLDGETVPEAVLVCNFPAPTPGDPALLLHDQVTTFFHEFGHLLHHLLAGRGRFLSLAGIATERDFVEVPSQLFEEWAWDARVLARFALHHETGEPIPAELVQRLRAAEDYGKGLTVQTQAFYGLLALGYHEGSPEERDLTAEMVALKSAICVLPHTPGTHFHASFGHLNGYSALYYTYLWSLVIAKDLLASFQPDLRSPEVARRYRAAVLAPGGSRDAAVLVRDFLGRDYSFEAFERWLAE